MEQTFAPVYTNTHTHPNPLKHMAELCGEKGLD